MEIKNWVLPIILGFMIGLIPAVAEENKLYDYELTLNMEEHWGKEMIESISVTVKGQEFKPNIVTNCSAGSKYSTTCNIITILQNEKIILQNDRMIEQFDTMIAQNEQMLDIVTVEDFDDWYP